MADTLLDVFAEFARAREGGFVYDNGYRAWTYSHADVARAARLFAARLAAAGIVKGDAVLFWCENRPEWIAAFWGCALSGVAAVPIDYRAPIDFLARVQGVVRARLLLVGEEIDAAQLAARAAADGARTLPDVWTLADLAWSGEVPATAPAPTITRDDTLEIIFTSGATAEPKGVVITHRNVLANLEPVQREILKYKKYGRPFLPLRFLNLLPLSHLFGQAMAAFIPPVLDGVVIFIRGYNPHEIVQQIRSRRISVLVCVPKILEVLRDHIVRVAPETAAPVTSRVHVARRWWRYRRVHRLFGFKFWSFVVGAAPLDPELEEFWSRLGFLTVQGYGLTETAPIVTLNHPFNARKGSVGKAIAGLEVKIAPDGEILVKGDSVTKGYYGADAETAAAFADGWLQTGDIGAFDEEGRLYIRGRKKEMIVTPEGLNVFPEDVERVLDVIPGVRESAVVGVGGSQERVHAVVVLEPVDGGPPPGADAIQRQANAQLADHQRIRAIVPWPNAALPRTEGTRKLKRREVKRWLEQGGAAPIAATDDPVQAVLTRFTGGRAVDDDATFDALGLSSLERVELMVAIEDRLHVNVDEATFGAVQTVGDLRAVIARTTGDGERGVARDSAAGDGREASPRLHHATGQRRTADHEEGPFEFPAWNRSLAARAVRRVSLAVFLLPLTRAFAWIDRRGVDRLDGVNGPVMFAANHQSHMDTPVILAALPRRLRYRVAVAMAKEFFKAHFFPDQHPLASRVTNSLNYYLSCLFFNAFPIPQREAGARQTLRYIGGLLAGGDSVLIFPEGKRTARGEINRFQSGIGMIGSKLRATVVPVRIDGLDRVLHQSWKMARPGRVRVSFGEPLTLEGDDYAALAARVERAVRALGPDA